MRDLNSTDITEEVISTMAGTEDPRLARILASLVRHAHDFVREVALTEEEWAKGVDFLTRTGHLCSPQRQEFILLSDVLGITMLVDAVNHRRDGTATENSVQGPYFRDDRPSRDAGGDISEGIPGVPLFFDGQVLDEQGDPVAGAAVDVWHSDGMGHYDVDVPGLDRPAMRGLFRTDAEGRFAFRSIRPASYPIPGDGTVGELMTATGRPLMRPAHIHLVIEATGHQRLTTMLFPSDDHYLDHDPVFGVKQSLIAEFTTYAAETGPYGRLTHDAYTAMRHTFVLEPLPRS
ncbi:dioxygenase [Streptomyces sp. NPDC001982]|uniref:dioxygenase family protein n=1 Tax=unclassified Streptomyces TaxID=2593676 RepID=UPI003319CEA3